MTTPIFFEDEAGEWRAQLKAANGEVVYTSEGYRDRSDAERGLGDLCATVDAVRGRQQAGVDYCTAHHGIRDEDDAWCAWREDADQNLCGTCDGDGGLFVSDAEPDVECPDCDGIGFTPCDLRPLSFETGERHG